MAKIIFQKSDAKLQERLIKQFGKAMLQIDDFFSKKQLQNLIFHNSAKIRTQIYMFARIEVIEQNKKLFNAALNTEPNRFLQSLFYARMMQNSRLKELFSEQNWLLQSVSNVSKEQN